MSRKYLLHMSQRDVGAISHPRTANVLNILDYRLPLSPKLIWAVPQGKKRPMIISVVVRLATQRDDFSKFHFALTPFVHITYGVAGSATMMSASP